MQIKIWTIVYISCVFSSFCTVQDTSKCENLCMYWKYLYRYYFYEYTLNIIVKHAQIASTKIFGSSCKQC